MNQESFKMFQHLRSSVFVVFVRMLPVLVVVSVMLRLFVLLEFGWWWHALLMVVFVGILLYAVFEWANNVVILADGRVFIQRGVFKMESVSLPIGTFHIPELQQNILEKMFGFGTIQMNVLIPSQGQTLIEIKYLRDSPIIMQQMLEFMNSESRPE